MDNELLIHGQVQGDVERLDKGVSAIGIAAKIGFRHPRHQMMNAPFAGKNSRYTLEEEVTTWHEGVRIAVSRFLLIHRQRVISQGIPPQLTDKADIHDMMFHTSLSGNFRCQFHLFFMFLPIDKTKSQHLRKPPLSPKQTGGRILPATKYY